MRLDTAKILDTKAVISTVCAAALIASAGGLWWVTGLESRSKARDTALETRIATLESDNARIAGLESAVVAQKIRLLALELTGEALPPHLADETTDDD